MYGQPCAFAFRNKLVDYDVNDLACDGPSADRAVRHADAGIQKSQKIILSMVIMAKFRDWQVLGLLI